MARAREQAATAARGRYARAWVGRPVRPVRPVLCLSASRAAYRGLVRCAGADAPRLRTPPS